MSYSTWKAKDLWVIAAGFIAAMHIGKLPAALPILQAEMGLSLVHSGLLLSLVQAAGMLLALLLGSYAAKIGLKRCMVLGLLILSASSFWAAYSPSLTTIFVTRLFEGLGFIFVTLTGAALLRQMVPAEYLAAKMGLWAAYMGGGMGIALMLTPYLMHFGSWQFAWCVFSLSALLCAVALIRYLPNPKAADNQVSIFQLIKMTLSHPPAWILALIFGMYAGQWFALVSFLPMIYSENDISVTLAGTLTAVVSIANAVGTFGCGLLLQRGWHPKTLVQMGFSILMICALGFYGLKEILPFAMQFGLVFSFSLCGGLVAATVLSQALYFAPNTMSISTTMGLVLQNSAISQFVLPPSIALVVSSTGAWWWAGVVMATLSGIGMLLTALLFKQKQSIA